jgi:hypothetical protein
MDWRQASAGMSSSESGELYYLFRRALSIACSVSYKGMQLICNLMFK